MGRANGAPAFATLGEAELMTHATQKKTCGAATAGGAVAIILVAALGGTGVACAPPAASPATATSATTAASPSPPKRTYPTMAPFEQYLEKSPADEIALARTAAPPSISADADVLVLGSHGYEPAVKGKNGFVCFVQRAWAGGFADGEFWNPRTRAPNCFNPEAARTELPQYLKRTEWVLAGASKQEMIDRTRAALADQSFKRPEPGAFSFMLSKDGYLNDEAGGPWYPHVMFFIPHGQAAAWGAGLAGSPILGEEGTEIESTVLFIPVRRWSDGSTALPPDAPHTHTK
jgi:hypothetical protein